MRDKRRTTEEEKDPKQGCTVEPSATKCNWLSDPESCSLSSHVNSFPGLPIRGLKGSYRPPLPAECLYCACPPIPQLLCWLPATYHTTPFSGVLPESHWTKEVMTAAPGATCRQRLSRGGSKDGRFHSVHAPWIAPRDQMEASLLLWSNSCLAARPARTCFPYSLSPESIPSGNHLDITFCLRFLFLIS